MVKQTQSDFDTGESGLDDKFGFDPNQMDKIKPLLSFLYNNWWRINLTGLNHLPKDGPALIVANGGGMLSWPGLMFAYALMTLKLNSKLHPDSDSTIHHFRRLRIMTDMGWIEDERIYSLLSAMGFVPWSKDNAKELFAQGELVIAFPEGSAGYSKTFSERYRLRKLDWTYFLAALEAEVPIYPLAVIGCDEAFPVFCNIESMAKLFNTPAFPVTPFFPFLPFPLNLLSLPVKWYMHLLKPIEYDKPQDREELAEIAKEVAVFSEGEIQAELNRLLRLRQKGQS